MLCWAFAMCTGAEVVAQAVRLPLPSCSPTPWPQMFAGLVPEQMRVAVEGPRDPWVQSRYRARGSGNYGDKA